MAGIYIHIPFCKQKCTYCNFHFSTSLSQKQALLEAIHKELSLQKDFLNGAPVDTIYFGGGTPSLLSSEEINRIFDLIEKSFPLDDLKEFTLETNPDDLNLTYLQSLRTTPVNRLSIGIQSFQDADLQFMNRAHTAREADYAIKAAQDKGFENLTIDLIYGSPQLSNDLWKSHLRKVKELNIPHFSAYALTVEENTLLHHSIQNKKLPALDQEKAAAQFEILMNQAEEMHFEHYEISNLAKKNAYAIHNTNYWKGVPYLGIGPSAHSFNGEARQWNIANNALYMESLHSRGKIPFEKETLTEKDRLNEYLMTSLRTMWGCDLSLIEKRWGAVKEIMKQSEPYLEKNMMVCDNRKLLLTRKGKLFADKIAGELFQ